MREFTEAEIAEINHLRFDSLEWEGMDLIRELPEGTPLDRALLYLEAKSLQDGNGAYTPQEAAASYLDAIGDTYLGNAFSLGMLPPGGAWDLEILETDPQWVAARRWTSVVGHADTAEIMSQILGKEVPFNRVSLQLQRGDKLYVGQYSGPRLPEGATSLPEGASIQWVRVRVK